MPRTDHHAKPYDESTILKLSLYESYLKEWLGVFVHSGGGVNIFDFHCGPGADVKGVKGSPLRCYDILLGYSDIISKNNTKIFAYFSDVDGEKINELNSRIAAYPRLPATVKINVNEKAFEDAFRELYSVMDHPNASNFLFIDPTGVAMNHEIFKKIFALKRTDFLLFTPSSFCLRFKGTPSFKKCHPDLENTEVEDGRFRHRYLCDYFKKYFIPMGATYYISPFSIKKERNVHGLIFGSHSLRGLEKFLRSCWRLDDKNGEANFGFRGDIPDSKQGLLLDEFGSIKQTNFNNYIRDMVLSGEIKNNKELFEQTLLKGFLPQHSKKILSELHKKGKIAKPPVLSYTKIFNEKRIEPIEVLK